jgi:cytochrome oxidase Cu insertion factor (SCO1/SenC/PrrC family)
LSLAGAFALAVTAGIGWWTLYASGPVPQQPAALTVPGVSIGGSFSLTDHTGRAVTDQTFRGKYLLVFFGFTACPDACPTGLMTVSQVMDQLGPQAAKVQPLFITVDPERDTPEQMAQYVAQFDERLVGLTGTPEQIREAAGRYRVYYAKQKPKDGDFYLVDHTAFFYLMDPAGKGVGIFRHSAKPEDLASAIRSHINKVAQG